RFAYKSFIGEIPNGLFILHKCDNPKCVNPEHLYAGTQKDNMQDRLKSGNYANVNKTHCPQGHEYNEPNLYVYQNRRYCRTCAFYRVKKVRSMAGNKTTYSNKNKQHKE
ncbi:MAG: HNH endonuclease signature motif containing protein, partial [Candidatus Bathyarchaeota archaeon]|nr:HNH endonuclease signature motif containing protein [Candidatus Bathyarchaeota archaeon]